MQKSNYLIKRKDRNYYTYQSKFNIPVSLQNHFGRKSFKISLKSGKYNQSCSLSNRLHKLLKVILKEIEMGNKKLTFEEVKSILKIEVDKSVLHIQHTETYRNRNRNNRESSVALSATYHKRGNTI